ncbi:MAG: SIS domain-containing protein [Myxococcales bacterium]|nr:SIS domain-containing protein [Myxococcales bacterium]
MNGYPEYASATAYLKRAGELMHSLAPACERLVDALYDAFEAGQTIFLAGNGGSAAAASHFGQDLAKGTLTSRHAERRMRVIPLTDNLGYITALANDEGYESVFEQQLRGLASSGDLLVAISGSGNSPNILLAVDYAASIGMGTVGVTGFDGGRLRQVADVDVHVPVDDMGMCEALHGVVFHYAMSELRSRLSRLENA